MWLVFTLVTTLIWGAGELFYKMGSCEYEKYCHLKICIYVGAFMGLHAIFVLITGNISYNPINLIYYLPVSLCYILSMTFSFYGIRYIEESISDPIENTSGAICSIMCVVFLGQRISGATAFAIFIMVIGILGIGFLEKRGDTDRGRKLGRRMAVIAFAMPFLYAIIDAFGSFLDVYFLDIKYSPLVDVSSENIELVANTSYELSFAIYALALYAFIRSRNVRLGGTLRTPKMLAALCETAGQFTYVFAMSGNGKIAAPILSSVCVVSLLLSRIVLKEKLTRRQYFFIALVIVGILAVAIIEGD